MMLYIYTKIYCAKIRRFYGKNLASRCLFTCRRGWSGGAKVLDKLSVHGRPTRLDDSRARAYCACNRCGWGLLGHFFSHLSGMVGWCDGAG